jgi:2-methylisocitrate lyase-like PEP mutase family enzyme
MESIGQSLRDLINAPEILVMPGVFDGLSARLVERSGFKAALITGAGVSESFLGWADVGLLGLEENLTVCRAIAGCSDVLYLADGDTGYGNAINVHYSVRGFERAGVAAVMLEDQVSPKRCGHLAGKEIIPAEEMVEKIRAAVEARRDPAFVIKGRTDAYPMHDLSEAIRRLNLYAEAGADLLMVDAIFSSDEIRAVARNVSKPLAVNMGYGIRRRTTRELISAQALQEMGVAVVLYPRLLAGCAIQGMKNGIDALVDSLDRAEVVEHPELSVSFQEQNELLGLPTIREMEARFLTGRQLEQKYGSKMRTMDPLKHDVPAP